MKTYYQIECGNTKLVIDQYYASSNKKLRPLRHQGGSSYKFRTLKDAKYFLEKNITGNNTWTISEITAKPITKVTVKQEKKITYSS